MFGSFPPVPTPNGVDPFPPPPVSGGGGAPVDAEYVVMALDATLTQERVLTAGSGVSIVDGGANGPVTISADAGAPVDAQYLVLALDPTLTEERLFTPGVGLTGTDGGADGPYTLDSADISFATVNDESATYSQARQLLAGIGIVLTDNGPGSTLEVRAAWQQQPLYVYFP